MDFMMSEKNKDGFLPGQAVSFADMMLANKKRAAKPVEANQDANEPLGTDSGDQLSNEQLRAAIKSVTGESPAGRTSRETLIKTYNELNAE
jgi:hypothetical protein